MRVLACIVGAILALIVLALAAIGLYVGYSRSGWLMLVGVALVAAGMVATATRRSAAARTGTAAMQSAAARTGTAAMPSAAARTGTARGRNIAGTGLILLALTVVGRLLFAGYGPTTMTTLPGGGESRWLGRVFDEQDACLVGALGLVRQWSFLPPTERAQLVPAMHDAYVAMRASEGITASPVVDTLLGRQRPDAFDALVAEPRVSPPKAAVVFLHGYAGSFTLECWMIAEAARAIDAATVCPATSFDGRWWTPEGERTLRATLAYVEARGIERVYLAGLSNGGIGASRLAPRLAPSLAGLILISGTSPDGSTARLPTLVVQGESDTNVSAAGARAFAARNGATYAGSAGGHFVMMVRRTEVQETIAAWLKKTSGLP
jgi:esterase/lipase